MKFVTAAVLACLTALAGPAFAQDRDYCPARPGLGTPACTIAPGRVSLEIGLADWQRDTAGGTRSDTFIAADTQARIGLSDTVEALIGWTPFGHQRVRDTATRNVSKASGIGDAYLGIKANLASPDGSGLSIAVQPFVTLPIGDAPLGATGWGAGIVLPVSYDLGDTLNLQFTAEADAAPNGDVKGRHLAYSGTLGLGWTASDAIEATAELQAGRDDDPDGTSTQWLGALSLGYMPSDDLQLDLGTNIGLNRNAPDVEVYFGISRLF
jgi:hypothetical protein